MGARSGDLVRALDAWHFTPMEGVLHLERSQDGVRVVIRDRPVIASSVEVIEAGVVRADSFDEEDQRYGGFDWHPIHDLDEAWAEGSVFWFCLRKPTYREDTYACSRAAIQPLLDAGWQLKEEQEWVFDQEFGVMESLERDGIIVNVECYEGRPASLVWTYSSDYEPDPEGEGSEPLFDATNNNELWSRFADEGWLGKSDHSTEG